ncbi:hypothetical protein L0Z66_00355 (plasmid) [Phaeobacter sp. BS34]|uniref:hypothetical protein n=1 Tax=Phaeobacter TaxID=302485 RepID=UPI000160CE86|nr:hypothetical protein [Phaeobacter inhibens]AFO89655.1 hypothetical protein PGA2_95p200 [Phaeobacter inhibens 2.10]
MTSLTGNVSWTKIGLSNTDYNDHDAFDAGINLFTALVGGTYLFGATMLYKVNSSTSVRTRGQLVLNGATEIRGPYGEVSGAHVSETTALWLQKMLPLTAGNTVELQRVFRHRPDVPLGHESRLREAPQHGTPNATP